MARPRVLPSNDTLAHWVEDGLSIEEMRQRIKTETGQTVAASSISAAIGRAGLRQRVRYDDMIPWERIAVEHNTHFALNQLRTAARIKRGLPVDDRTRARHERWLEELEEANAIVAYDYNSIDGFYYAKRAPGERGLARP